jgi:hypothetical protein
MDVCRGSSSETAFTDATMHAASANQFCEQLSSMKHGASMSRGKACGRIRLSGRFAVSFPYNQVRTNTSREFIPVIIKSHYF